MKQSKTRPLHQCTCETCQQHPYGEIAEEHRAITRVLAILDEKSRRRFVGLLASRLDHGGIQLLIEITGLSRNTICRGRAEVQRVEPRAVRNRLRAPDGGRQKVEKKTRRF
jgi:hypothetical protein